MIAYRGKPRQKKEASEKGQHFPFRVKKRLVEQYNQMELPQKREVKKEVKKAFAIAIFKIRNLRIQHCIAEDMYREQQTDIGTAADEHIAEKEYRENERLLNKAI